MHRLIGRNSVRIQVVTHRMPRRVHTSRPTSTNCRGVFQFRSLFTRYFDGHLPSSGVAGTGGNTWKEGCLGYVPSAPVDPSTSCYDRGTEWVDEVSPVRAATVGRTCNGRDAPRTFVRPLTILAKFFQQLLARMFAALIATGAAARAAVTGRRTTVVVLSILLFVFS